MRADHTNGFPITSVLLVVMFLTLAALAQQAVPPPPKPADSGPSLAVTMKFLQDKLNEEGPINFTLFVHDDVGGSDWVIRRTFVESSFSTDANLCLLKYHLKRTDNGQQKLDVDQQLNLKSVQSVSVMTEEQSVKINGAADGQTGQSLRCDPSVFAMRIKIAGVSGGASVLLFHDEDTANRVAKALNHAVELCGGGQNEPF